MPDKRSMNRITSPKITTYILYAALLLLMLPGCSKGGDPVIPDASGEDSQPAGPQLTAGTDYPESNPGTSGGKAIWGVWDVTFSKENGFEVIPLRGVEFTLNVNVFLQPPAGSLTNINIDIVNWEKLFISGSVTVDVSITHPFPQYTEFTGFDVMGTLIGTGTYIANSDIGIMYSKPRMDPILLNADGYTRWMNPLEFVSGGLVGFEEGALGNKGVWWGSTLNPFKYFADGLYTTETVAAHFQSGIDVINRGLFSTGQTNTRRYDIQFAMTEFGPDVRFQYVILASWKEPSPVPPFNIPEDFPAEANLQEPIHCAISTVGSSLYWNSMYDNGGSLFLTLEVFDWQGATNPSGVAGEIKQIVLDSPDEFINGGNKLIFNPTDWIELPGDSSNSIKLALDIGQVEPGGPCPYDNDILVTLVTAEEGDYDNGLGAAYPANAVLSAYARLFVDMGYVCNEPPILWIENCPENILSAANKSFMWDAVDDVTPNELLEYSFRMDSDPWTAWELDVKIGYFENMTEGSHTLEVECRDSDGQVTHVECDFVIDLPPEPQPPEVEFANCNPYVRNSSKNFNLDISDDYTPISLIKVRYDYDGSGWIGMPDGTTTIPLTGLNSGGPHTLVVEVEDLDGMTDQAICVFDVNFKPSVSIDNCPAVDLNASSIDFTWTGVDPELDPLEYQTQIDMSGWTGWGPATNRFLSGLSSGNHVFYVRVRDITGGQDQTQCNFSVNFGPTISINNKPTQDVNGISYIFNWTASDDLDSPLTMEYNVELDGVWQGWQTGILSYNWTPLTSGPRTFRVRVRDTGNPGLWAEDVCNFFVNFKPGVTIDDCPVGVWPSEDITFNWTGTDDNSPPGGMSYSWKLNSDPWAPWSLGSMSAPYTGLSTGDHTFSVRVRDTGSPALQCDTPPDTCDTCNFTIDTDCSFPPANVINFNASDGTLLLNNREVELTWDALPGCVDWYEIERWDWDWVGYNGYWNPVQDVIHPTNSWIDTDARYAGTASPIQYRIRAVNVAGNSPGWSTDTGYPIMRNVKMALWCVADDLIGTNPATPWSRGAADFMDSNEFWNKYGINCILENTGNFFWIDNPAYRHLVGGEGGMMHSDYGMPGVLDVFYVESSNGNYGRGYCMCYCPGSAHNLNNVYIVLCRDTRGTPPSENPIVLAHENGHAIARFFDEYQLDPNRNLILDDGVDCNDVDTWCTVPPNSPWLFCDDNSAYPENPGASGKVPKQLMWYSFIGSTIPQYDITEVQWFWVEDWMHGYEANYPYP